jgi:deoxyribose-phosphate aldolase
MLIGRKMEDLNKYIEHTNLKPDCTQEDVIKLCEEAVAHKFYGVCVSPYFVQLAKKTIAKNPVKIITVVGFPFGYNTVASKVEETKKAIIGGADEVDVVMNIAAFKSGDDATVLNDLQAVIMACHLQNKLVKVIIETALLNKEEIEKACRLCVDSEADFVKTSTGFAATGAEIESVELMRKILPPKVKIKAAGGIKDASSAEAFILAGAARIGTSSGIGMMESTMQQLTHE